MSGLYAPYNHNVVFRYNHRIVLCWYQTGGHTYGSYVSLIKGKPSDSQWGTGAVLTDDLGTTQVPCDTSIKSWHLWNSWNVLKPQAPQIIVYVYAFFN